MHQMPDAQTSQTGKSELLGLLKDLRWRTADLTRAVEVEKNTGYRWTSGKARVPGSVLAYLRLLRDVLAIGDRNGRPGKKGRHAA